MTTPKNIKKEFDKLVSGGASQIALVTHINPDDDAVGSVLAIYWYLTKYFPTKHTRMLLTGEKDSRFDYLANADKILWVDDVSDHLADTELLVILDCNDKPRFTKFPEKIDLPKFKTALFDHHPEKPAECTLVLSSDLYASVTHLLTKVLFTDKDLTDPAVAEPLLIGIYSDTGSFEYVDKKRADVFTQSQRIVQNSGIEIQAVHARAQGMPIDAFMIITKLMQNTKNIDFGGKIPPLTYSYLEPEFVAPYSFADITSAYHTYMSYFIRKLEGHGWGFVLTPRDDKFKLSFRSLPGVVNVKEICNKHFEGGGHVLAAGGSIQPTSADTTAEQMCQTVLEIIKNANIKAGE